MLKSFHLLGLTLILAYTCSHQGKLKQKENTVPIKAEVREQKKASVDFVNDIQPILKSHCMPCHFPGGSMYLKMPFDNPKTILDHTSGVFKRIKDPEEVKKIKSFIEESAG